jgi:hypothetical protein
VDDCSALTDIYNALYSGTEALTVAGSTHLATVRAMAPTGLWMLLTRRMQRLRDVAVDKGWLKLSFLSPTN